MGGIKRHATTTPRGQEDVVVNARNAARHTCWIPRATSPRYVCRHARSHYSVGQSNMTRARSDHIVSWLSGSHCCHSLSVRVVGASESHQLSQIWYILDGLPRAHPGPLRNHRHLSTFPAARRASSARGATADTYIHGACLVCPRHVEHERLTSLHVPLYGRCRGSTHGASSR